MVPLKRMTVAGSLIFFLMLCSCGEFDSVFPINQTYQVSATAGDYSLDEYSVIRLDDEIQPFFVHSISGDPDIRGLMVFFQTPDGKPAGQKIRYSIGDPEEEKEEEDKEREEEEEEDELLILAAGMERKLLPFRMSEDLKIGPYRMIFQVLGENGKVFSKTKKPVFYLAAEDYNISEISPYLPGYVPDSYLIAPETLIMLEARVTAGEGLDPYVVWYDGKKRIGEGKISDGGNKFFFKIPEENGFRLLRAEAFPFQPEGQNDAGNPGQGETAKGKIRELSLPVSLKGKGLKPFFSPEEGERFAGHYLFVGDLLDSLDAQPERALVKENGEAGGGLNWLGYGGIYGLAVGPDDCYLIPQTIFGDPEQDQAIKIFSFRCKMLKDGTIFSVLPETGPAFLELFREKENLVLTLKTEENSGKVETTLPATDDFIVFTLSLAFRENTLTALLSPEGMPPVEVSLDLTGVPAAELIYRLGSPLPGKTEEDESSGEEEKDTPELPALILDELAVTAREE
jgi:hypothetical protein